MNKLTTNVTSMNNDTKNWKDKIHSISINMRDVKQQHDISNYHKVAGVKHWLDTNFINKILATCKITSIEVRLTDKRCHLVPVDNIDKSIVLNEDKLIHYLYNSIYVK